MTARRVAAVAVLVAALAGGCARVPVERPAPDTALQPHHAQAAGTGATGQPATVTKVTDGDTVHVRYDNGTLADVRLLGLNTPETKDPKKPPECWGQQASARAHQLLDGQQVVVTADPTQAATDKYGRTLAYLTLPDGRDYSDVMVGEGQGVVYVYTRGHPPQEYPTLAVAQQQARNGRLGLWGACPSPPTMGQVGK